MSYGLALCEDDKSRWKWLLKNADHDPVTVGLAVGATAPNAAAAGMAVYSIGATVIGTGISAMGQAQAGASANAVAQRNAQIQMRDAQLAKQNAEFNAKMKEKQDDAKRRRMIKSQGGSGVDALEGTNLIALAEQEFIDDMNAQLIRRGGTLESQGLQSQAAITSASGRAAKAAGMTGAGASLLTGLGNVGQNYATLDDQGVFD